MQSGNPKKKREGVSDNQMDWFQGAGDQGVTIGYACDETPQLMPMPVVLANRIVRELSACRRSSYIEGICPDGKAQVTVEYEDGKPVRLDSVVVSCQHTEDKNLKKLEVFIGPPLKEQFMKYAGLDEETAVKAVKYYRERYSNVGIFENKPYPGVENMLQELKRKKYILAVASSKPEDYVKQILDHFHLTEYFDEIVGSEMNGARTNKTEVIEEALERIGMKKHREQVVMVGDKEHDVLGAREAGLDCVAVSYGYGTTEELKEADPLQTVASADELLDFFG